MSTSTEIVCPRERSEMTPCIARDGAPALTDLDAFGPAECVGCGFTPRRALIALAKHYAPAGPPSAEPPGDPRRTADLLRDLVRAHVEAKP